MEMLVYFWFGGDFWDSFSFIETTRETADEQFYEHSEKKTFSVSSYCVLLKCLRFFLKFWQARFSRFGEVHTVADASERPSSTIILSTHKFLELQKESLDDFKAFQIWGPAKGHQKDGLQRLDMLFNEVKMHGANGAWNNMKRIETGLLCPETTTASFKSCRDYSWHTNSLGTPIGESPNSG